MELEHSATATQQLPQNSINSINSLDVIYSSDQGELEEEAARTLGEEYWTQGSKDNSIRTFQMFELIGDSEQEEGEEEKDEQDSSRIDCNLNMKVDEAVSSTPIRIGSDPVSSVIERNSPIASSTITSSAGVSSPCLNPSRSQSLEIHLDSLDQQKVSFKFHKIQSLSSKSPSPTTSAISDFPEHPLSPGLPSQDDLVSSTSPTPTLLSSQPLISSLPLPSHSFHDSQDSQPLASTSRLLYNEESEKDASLSPIPYLSQRSEPIEPDLELYGARSFRQRTAAQLKPYSIENAKYTRTMVKNGWQGAVVMGPRVLEETEEELKIRKQLAELNPRDNLGGWLEFEEAQEVISKMTQDSTRRRRDSDEESYNGDEILEREARRKEALLEMEKTFGVFEGKGKGKGRNINHHHHDKPPHSPPAEKRVPKKLQKQRDLATKNVSSSRAQYNQQEGTKKRSRLTVESTSRGFSSEGDSPRKNVHKHDQLRAGSEPLSSPVQSTSKATGISPHKKIHRNPSKSFHLNNRPSHHLNDIDEAILALSSPSNSDNHSLEVSSSEEEVSDASSSNSVEVVEKVVSKNRLGGKKKKALRSMMPAVFMKKAQADLKLMEKEALEGGGSGSDQGSGDGASDSSTSDGARTTARALKLARGRGIIKKSRRDMNGFITLDDTIFTDESGDDGRPEVNESSSQDEETDEEVDTLPSWIKGYARSRRPVGEDTVAKFLRQAKTRVSSTSKSKSKSNSRKNPTSGAGVKQKPSSKSSTGINNHVLAKRPRIDTRPLPNFSTRPSVKSIPLDTDRALFKEAPSIGKSSSTNYIEIRHRDATITREQCLDSLEGERLRIVADPIETERWATYSKFSHDFDIQKLKAGTQFPSTSYVGSGQLLSLVSPLVPGTRARFVRAFDISFNSRMPPEELQLILPTFCDAIYSDMVGCNGDTEDTQMIEAFKFLGIYLLEVLPNFETSLIPQLLNTLSSQLAQLKSRLTSYATDLETSIDISKKSLLLSLYFVDMAGRILRINSEDLNHKEQFQNSVKSLIQRLISHGPEHTTKSLKSLTSAQIGPEDVLIIHDNSVEAWSALISLSLSMEATFSIFQPSDLWELVTDTVIKSLPNSTLRSPVGGEILSYTATMLCAISQFLPSGLCTSLPQLPAHWSILTRTLDLIQPSSLSKTDHTISNSSLARRDRYLWTLFARTLVFADRWNWNISTKDDLVPKLYDLVNARRLANLTIESDGEFPSFLARIGQLDTSITLVKNDTMFIIFLKILIRTANCIPNEPAGDKRKQLTRFFVRLSPLSTGPWTRLSPEISRGTSILINHYSLWMTFAALSPMSINQRLDQARRLLNLSEVDEAPRRNLIRAILYFTLIFRHNSISITPLVDWISTVVIQLRTEFKELERDLLKKSRTDGRAVRILESGETALWNRAVLLSMALRAVQVVIGAKHSTATTEVAFPELELLQPALTTQLLESSLALIPIIGNELLDLIESFLDVRARVIQPRRVVVEESAGVSQDEFGMFEMDYEDPVLNTLLGVEVLGQSNTQNENNVKDKAFVKFVASSLSPSLFRLLSNIFAPTTGIAVGPNALDRSAFSESVLQCWTRCIAILVDNDLADWSSYLRYGDNSWKRLGDPIGRREVGLLLAIHLCRYNDVFLEKYQTEFLEIWFQTIIFPNLIHQHQLTSALFNMETPSQFFEDIPFARDPDSNKFVIELSDLQIHRIALLKGVVKKAGQLLKRTQIDKILPTSTVLNSIRDMLLSMQNNLEVIPSEGPRREYSTFCRTLLDEIKSTGSLNEQNLPTLRALYQAVT